MMTQADCLIKAVIACLEARFQEDRGNTERGIPDGFPVPLKMAVDEDREGKEYALFQAAEMEEWWPGTVRITPEYPWSCIWTPMTGRRMKYGCCRRGWKSG